jgi:hypothetical protein
MTQLFKEAVAEFNYGKGFEKDVEVICIFLGFYFFLTASLSPTMGQGREWPQRSACTHHLLISPRSFNYTAPPPPLLPLPLLPLPLPASPL